MKSLTIFIAALVVTLILNGPIQSYADPQLDTLVNIATQARSNLNISISQISNVPNEIISLYKQGSDETDALTTAVNAQNVTSAKQHFLAAMNFFKTTNDKINSLNATEANDQQRITIMQLQSEITRLEKIAETLQTIAITNHVDFNFTQFNTSLAEAKQDLDTGNIEEAAKSLDTANQLIIDAHHSLSEVAQQRAPDRAKDFTEKQIERFDKIPDLNTTQSIPISASNITMSKTSSNVTSIENPGEMIAKLRKLVSEGNVDEALKIIKSLDAYQKGTLKNNETQVELQSQTSVKIQNDTGTNSNPSSTNPSNVTTTNLPSTNPSNVTTTNHIKTDSSNNENPGQPKKDEKIDKTNFFHDENSNFSSTNLSNTTNLPNIDQSNITKANTVKINSFHDENSNFSSTNPSNVTTTNHIKTDSSNNENPGQPKKDEKIDKTNFFQHKSSIQQGKDNKTEFQVIPQGGFDSEQQNKTHEQNHGKILVKQKREKQNHD